ncbi:MAG: hypothetical protein J4F34_02295 [Gemmatimonadetes bacterium]|nr:hypothetical protein [Gemmatimonadota bacterium]
MVPVGHHVPGDDPYGTRWVSLEGAYNTGRLPRYLRLDLGWRRGGEGVRAGGRLFAPFVSVTNLFSAPNVLAGEVRVKIDTYDEPVTVEREYIPQMPMLAFFGVEFRF